MADNSGPFDASGGTGSWAQAQWYAHAPSYAPSGVLGVPQSSASAGPLGISFSGLTGTLAVGNANVRGAGFERDTAANFTATTNGNASLSRRDRVVLRRDLAAKTVTVAQIQGTPSSSPAAPTVQRNDGGQWDLPLFSFLVPPNNGTGITGIVDERAWVALNSSAPVSVWNSNGLTALSAFGDAPTGMIAFTASDGRRNQWESTVWHRLPVDGLVFSTIAARNAWFGVSNPPVAGDRCLCLGAQMAYDGAAWRFILSGAFSGTTDANGFLSIPHGGGQAPVGWVITPAYQGDSSNFAVKVLSSNNAGDPTFLGCRLVYNNSSYATNAATNVTWMAQF